MTTELHHDLDLERALLGALAVDSAQARASMNGTSGADLFHKPAHAHIYEAIVDLDDAGQYIDVGVVRDHLRQSGLLEVVGGEQGILDACRLEDAPPASAAGQLAERLGRLRRLRRLQHAAVEAALAAQSGDADEAARRLTHALAHDQAITSDGGVAASLVDWSTFWTKDRSETEWALDPLWPRGRAINQYAPRGLGKSEFTLYCAAGLATGQALLGQPEGDPLTVVYLDLEMGEDDLYDRLDGFGYGPESDLSHLWYYVLPTLPPLNTAAGGSALMDIRATHDADLVIVDTLARVATGEENSNDTWIGLGTHTLLRLRAEGTTSVWLGHAGKDLERGERGGSAKGDAVDCIWEQSRGDGGTVRFVNKKRRSGWVPETVGMRRTERHGTLRYELVEDVYPTGTGGAVEHLDVLDAPDSITNRAARALLKEHGISTPNDALAAAVKWRKRRPAGEERRGFTTIG